MARLLAVLRTEPATVYITALGTVAAVVVALAHLDATQAGVLATAATAAGTLLTALLARPWHVAVIAGAAGTILQVLVVFRVPLTADEIAAVVQAISLGLGMLAMRPNLSPVVSMRDTGTHVKAVPDL